MLNILGDPDIRRIKRNQRWYSRYLNQHIFVPILYGFLAIKVRLQDINIVYIIGSNDQIRLNSLTKWQTFIFWGGKVIYLIYYTHSCTRTIFNFYSNIGVYKIFQIFFIIYRLIIPMLILPFWKVLTLFAISDTIASYWLALTFQANHVVDEVEW